MTRIIAGSLGGRRIAVPPRGTRPTTDRVREAVFSRLDHADAVAGARVLDLFAGSGALGLEALSRGAASVVLVDSAPQAAAVARANAEALGVRGRADVRRMKASVFLDGFADSGLDPFDLVFLDPPYDHPDHDLARVLAALPGALAPGAAVVLERAARAAGPSWPEGLAPERTVRYGETAVHYARLPAGRGSLAL